MELIDQIKEILEDVRPDLDFEEEQSLIDDSVLDSIDIISIVSELNENFDIEINVQHLLPENFNSLEDIVNLVEKLQEE